MLALEEAHKKGKICHLNAKVKKGKLNALV
jgi:hypothetical protein